MTSSYHRQELAPGGCSHAILLHLNYHSTAPSRTQNRRLNRGKLISQLVTARDDVIRIYDIYVPNGLSPASSSSSSRHHIVLARQHDLFGTVTGLQRIETLASDHDGRDRLLVSFNDAKLALLEWSDVLDDLETVSIHTYERATQLFNGAPQLFQPILQVDPLSRCAALLLPHDALAILPFYRDAAELDFDSEKLDGSLVGSDPVISWPYSPSFILTMREVDPRIENLRDFCFLPGFQKPTVAVMFSQSPTWTGLLSEKKDTFSVYLFTLDLSASIDGPAVAPDPYGDGVFRSAHSVVTTSSALPFDCLYMVPCPQSLGGVLVVTMNSLVHIDQSGRVVVTAITEWFKTMSALDVETILHPEGVTDLQASQLAFTGDANGVLTLANGDLYAFQCRMDGRSMEGIGIERLEEITSDNEYVPATCLPSSTLRCLPGNPRYVFSASMAGSSSLYELVATRRAIESEAVDLQTQSEEKKQTEPEMDLDDDLYGDSEEHGLGANGANGLKTTRTVMTLSKAGEVRSHGGFSSMSRRQLPADTSEMAKRHGLVACSGAGKQAELVYLDPRLTLESKQRIDRTEQLDSHEDSASSMQNLSKVFVVGSIDDNIQLLCSADDSDSSLYLSCSETLMINHTTELPRATLFAAPILGSNIGRITSTSLQIVSADLKVLHETLISEAVGSGVHAVEARIDAKEFVILYTSNGDTLIFRLDLQQTKFELLDISAALGNAQAVCLNAFRDVHSQLGLPKGKSSNIRHQADEDEVDFNEDEGDHEEAQAIANGKPFLFVLDSSDVCRILSLPDLNPVWQNHSLAAQPQRLAHEKSRQGDLSVEQVATIPSAVAYHIGDTLSIVSMSADNFISVFELVSDEDKVKQSNGSQTSSLGFNKIFVDVLVQPTGARAFDPNGNGYAGRSQTVNLQPLVLSCPWSDRFGTENALAILGAGREASVSVLYKPEQGSIRVLDWPEGDAVSVSSAVATSAISDLIYCDRRGALWTARLPKGLHDGSRWMLSSFRTGREYTKVVAHDSTRSIVAASLSPCPFVLYDEDGEPVKDPTEDHTPAYSQRGALELFIDEDKTTPVDGYEFEANETVTALEVVNLDAPSHASGRKRFIAAGTTTYHGEDRTSKGSVYLFEVVEVVSGRYQIGKDLRLKLICRDETKAPVTAIADINGLLVNTFGQKLYVRALEKEEWLIPVAFQDCPYYITSIRVVKNLILLSDLKRSLWFLAFQEEPYRFVSLGKDVIDQNVTMGNFLVNQDKLSLVATSGEAMGGITGVARQAGVLRLLEYAPSVPTSLGGHRLLLRSEFQTSSEAVASTICRGRWLSDSELRGKEEGRNKLIFAKANGALETLASVDEKVAKRLHLLQGQLVRSVQHFAGLNPRGFRTVRNDYVSRPLAKGVLDGRLLNYFLYLSRPKMLEAVRSLQGVFDGLDQIKALTTDKKRKHTDDEDADASTNDKDDANAQQDEGEDDFTHEEELRRKSEQKRVQLVIKDLLRLRNGFEQV